MAIDLEAAYTRYGPMVLRRCRFLLADEEEAVDAMQDVFVRLLRYGDRTNDTGLCSYLYRIATHVALNRLRSRKRRPTDVNDDLVRNIADVADWEADSLARRLLDRIFAREATSTRAIAVMHFVDGMTLEEVARDVGMSVSGVRKRLRLLRERVSGLREYTEAKGVVE